MISWLRWISEKGKGYQKGEGESKLKNISADRIGQKTVSIHWAMESQKDLIVQQFYKGFDGASHLYKRISLDLFVA